MRNFTNFLIKPETLVFAIIILGQITYGQQQPVKSSEKNNDMICSIDYSDVIDYLFPLYSEGQGSRLILRYTPPGEPEMQINIFYPDSGEAQILFFEAKERSVLSQLEDLSFKNKQSDFQDIVKQIKINKTQIKLSETSLFKIRQSFFEIIKKSLELEQANFNKDREIVIFDKARYEVWFLGVEEMHLRGEGDYIDVKSSKKETPFVKWGRELFRMIKNKQNSN